MPAEPELLKGDDWDAVLDDHPDAKQYEWRVEGTQHRLSPGAMAREFDVNGVIQAEGAGEALHWLVVHGPMWDGLDLGEQFTVSIYPVSPQGEALVQEIANSRPPAGRVRHPGRVAPWGYCPECKRRIAGGRPFGRPYEVRLRRHGRFQEDCIGSGQIVAKGHDDGPPRRR
jgi:hypothetical protein